MANEPFKAIGVRAETYHEIVKIAEILSREKGVPISLAVAVKLLIEDWQKQRGKK